MAKAAIYGACAFNIQCWFVQYNFEGLSNSCTKSAAWWVRLPLDSDLKAIFRCAVFTLAYKHCSNAKCRAVAQRCKPSVRAHCCDNASISSVQRSLLCNASCKVSRCVLKNVYMCSANACTLHILQWRMHPTRAFDLLGVYLTTSKLAWPPTKEAFVKSKRKSNSKKIKIHSFK